MKWLDKGKCSGACSSADTFSQISNLRFYTNGSGVTPDNVEDVVVPDAAYNL